LIAGDKIKYEKKLIYLSWVLARVLRVPRFLTM